jgi:hypothetical protein
MRVAGEDRWGAPPSRFVHPPEDLVLPVGRYRLLARKKGRRPDEVKVVLARFGYRLVAVDHGEEHYRVAISLELTDGTETRRTVPVVVRVLGRDGGVLDEREVGLGPVPQRKGRFASRAPLRLSSTRRRPDRDAAAGDKTGVLMLRPGCRLELGLGSRRFEFPVPLPPGRESRAREMEEEKRLKNREAGMDDVSRWRRPGERGRTRAPGGPR